jgi:hypothetical protein
MKPIRTGVLRWESIAFILLFVAISTRSAELTLKGEWKSPLGESASFITVKDNKAFLTTLGSHKLKILDVSNALHPTLIGEIELIQQTGDFVRLGKPAVYGSHVFVIGRTGPSSLRLFSVNISNEFEPQVEQFIDYAGNYATSESARASFSSAVDGTRLYVPLGPEGFDILDISNPSEPVSLGHPNFGGFIFEIKAANGLAYLAAGDAGLRIVDVTIPQATWLVGSVASGQTKNVALDGKYAYLVSYIDGSGVLQAVNVSNPVNPSIDYSFPPVSPTGDQGVNADGLALSGSAAIVGYGSFGSSFCIYNIAGSPEITKSAKVKSVSTSDIDIAGHYAYVADRPGGLVIYDIEDLTHPVRLSNYQVTTLPLGVAASENLVFLRDGYNGTHIIDATDSARPIRLSTYTPEEGMGLGLNAGPSLIIGETAYFSTWSGFDIVDIKNPASPVRMGAFRNYQGLPTVVASGSYAYTSSGEIVDISDAAHPRLAGTFSAGAPLQAMKVSGQLLYYSLTAMDPDTRYEIGVLDITQPLAPKKRGTISGIDASDMALDFPYLFVTTGPNLAALYIGDPDRISIAYTRPSSSQGRQAVAISDGNLFQFSEPVLSLTDASQPSDPIPGPSLTVSPLAGGGIDLAAQGNRAFLMSPIESALRIYEGSVDPRPVRPTLKIVLSGTNVVLRWPRAFSNFKLYSMTDLFQARQLVTANPFIDGDDLVFTNTRPLGTAVFYNLSK